MTEYLEKLSPYMLTNKNIVRFTKDTIKVVVPPKPKKYTCQKTPSNIFIPYQEDKLFWIYFFIMNGYTEYHMVGTKSFSVETEMKLNLVNKLKEQKSLLKEHKFKKIEECVSELLSAKKISFKLFEMLCVIHNVSIVLLKSQMYHKIAFEDTKETYLIHVVNGFYGCEQVSYEDMNAIVQNRYEVSHIDKPITSIGSFKMDDVVSIANILRIDLHEESGKKRTKQELYQSVFAIVNNFFEVE